jgi:hypothetical protein
MQLYQLTRSDKECKVTQHVHLYALLHLLTALQSRLDSLGTPLCFKQCAPNTNQTHYLALKQGLFRLIS